MINTIKDVYLSGKVGDYVVTSDYPNLHMVTTLGATLYAPIYSENMYVLFDAYMASKEIYNKVDKLYAQFKQSKQNN